MADRELRKMNRTELIEIIYALQVNERSLREENENMRRQLDDKLLRMEKAGSIAEAALGLNHIFEDAQNAAAQYLESLQKTEEEASRKLEEAEKKAEEILLNARLEADDTAGRIKEEETESNTLREKTENECQALKEQAENECRALKEQTENECCALKKQTETECRELREQTRKEIAAQRAAFVGEAARLLKKYPSIAAHMWEEKNADDEADTASFYQENESTAPDDAEGARADVAAGGTVTDHTAVKEKA